MKIFYIEIKTSKTMHPGWGVQTMIIRAKSRESLGGLIEGEFDMPLEAIVDNVDKDIEIQEYSFEGCEGVLAHG